MDATYSERDYWEARYRAGLDSGPGSGGAEAAWKVEEIPLPMVPQKSLFLLTRPRRR